MANEFDPYHKWLGIPKSEQPPHHYRLLAIPVYESDPQVIEAAADRQMVFLRRHQAGEHGEAARRLLGEVSRARLCLLKPDAKAKYDTKLEERLQQLAAASREQSAADDAAELDVLTDDAPPIEIQVTGGRKRSSFQLPAIIAGSIMGCLTVVFGMLYFSPPKPGEEKTAQAGSDQGGKKSQGRNSSGSDSGTRPRRDFQARPQASGDKAPWPTLLDENDPVTEKTDTGTTSEKPKSNPKNAPNQNNLISKIDLKRDVVQGNWKIEDGVLASGTGLRDRLQIPGKVPDSYTLTVVAERRAKSGPGLVAYLPVGKNMVLATVDGWNQETSALDMIENKQGDVNETMTIGAFTRQGMNRYVYHVQPDQVLIEVNGKKVLEWIGDSQLFSIHPQYAVPRTGEIGLAVFGVQWRVHSITVDTKPRSKVTPPESPREPEWTPAGYQFPIIETAENLIKKINPTKDAIQGIWKIDENVLIAPSGARDRIRIPIKVPASYTLTLHAERPAPNGVGLSVVLPIGNKQVLATVSGWQGFANGLDQVNGTPGDSNESTTFVRLIKPGVNAFQYRVTPNGIRVEVNGRKAVDWKGNPDKLTLDPGYALSKPDELGLVGGLTEWHILGIKLEGSSTGGGSSTMIASNSPLSDAPQGALTVDKKPVPDAAALEGAKKALKEQFKIDYAQAKKANDAKITLARTLFAKGQEANTDQAACYALLSEASELASEAGQLGLAWDSIVALTDRFDINRLPLMERASRTAAPFAKAPDEIRELTSMYATLVNEAVRVNDFDTASKLLQAANTAARKQTVYMSLRDQVASASKRISNLREAFEEARPARETLNTNPNDPAASFIWGRFLSFHKVNWTEGLPLIAAGTDPTWSPLAQRELGLNEASPPPDSEVIVKLADDLWNAAESQKEPQRTSIREHAAEVYVKAAQGLTGLAKNAVYQKADRIFGNSKVVESAGDDSGVTVAPPEVQAGTAFTVEFWVSTEAKSGTLISKQGDGDSPVILYLEEGFVGIQGTGAARARGNTDISDGKWHHVAGVKVARELLLFVDGKKEGTVATDNAISKSAWKAGAAGDFGPLAGRFARVRFSDSPRYLISFFPEKQYGKDSNTVFPK